MTKDRTPAPLSISALNYRNGLITNEIQVAALKAASQCGYEHSEEIYLGGLILEIRWVDAQSVSTYFPEYLGEPSSFDANAILRIDWQNWVISKQYDGLFDKAIIERHESIVVAEAVLLSGEVFTSGLGPEYNWMYWEDLPPMKTEPPQEVFSTLREVIKNEWRDEILDYAEGDDGYLDRINPLLKSAVESVIKSGS